MTEQEVKDKVRAVLRLMRPEWRWAAMDERGSWWAHVQKPDYRNSAWMSKRFFSLSHFDLPLFPGDWRDSLVEREE